MNPSAVNIAVVDGKTITQTQELRTAKAGEAVRIKAVKGGSYILGEGEKGVAPENITVKRVGKNLHVSLEGTDLDQPQLIIEDFYGSDSQLVGMAEDGSYHEYISSDADLDSEAAFLIDGDSSAQVLGSDQLLGYGNGLSAGSGLMAAGGMGFLPALMGLGALALAGAAYAVGKNQDNGGDDNVVVPPGAPGVPAAQPIGGVHDNVGDVQGPIQPGGTTDDRSPTFTGTGTPGGTVVIRDGGKVIGEAPIDADGIWEFTPANPLPEGPHSIDVVERDANGNVGAPSDAFELIVDTTAPGKSAISGVIDDVGDIQGIVANGGFTDDTRPTLTGLGEANSRIDVFNGTDKIGETTVKSDGSWSYTPEVDLLDGEYVFTTVAVDAAGNAGLPSDPYTITIDTVAPDKGVIGEVVDDNGLVIGNGDATNDDTPTFSGGGLIPGDIVVIVDKGEVIGTTPVDGDGNWEWTPDEELAEGDHSVVIIIRDPAGNESEPSDPVDFDVDLTAPVMPGDGSIGPGNAFEGAWDDIGPVVGQIMPGDATDDAQPLFRGAGLEEGDIVIIRDKGEEIGRVEVGEGGNWSWTPDADMAEGDHSVDIVIRDKAGNESLPSDSLDFDIDLTAPVMPGDGSIGPGNAFEGAWDDIGPVVGQIMPGDATDDAQPLFRGAGLEEGDIVIIRDKGEEIGRVEVGEGGNWSWTPDADMAEGDHSVDIVIRDKAGNESLPSDSLDFDIDLTAPMVPTIESVFDDQGNQQGNLTPGDITDDARPTIEGKAEFGSVVIIYDDGLEIGRASVSENGDWKFEPTLPLRSGPHNLTVKAVDAAGNLSDPSDGFGFELIAGGVPAAPAITGVTDNVGDIQGNLQPGSTTDDNTPTIHGTAQALSTVNVYDGANLLGTATADLNGIWEFTPSPALADGLHNITATAVNAAGNVSPATGNYPITVDTVAPDAALIGDLTDNVGAIIGVINNGDTTDDNTPTFNGTAELGSTVIVFDGPLEIGRANVGENGEWSFTPVPPLADGNHSLSTVVVDAAGNSSPASTPIDFTVDTSTVEISINYAEDNEGVIKGDLASGSVTDDTTPTLHGQATKNATVNIYLEGELLGSASVDGNGNWSYTPSPALLDGSHNFTATVVTAATGESDPTAGFNLVIDTVTPGKPTIGTITDDVGEIQGLIANGDSTDDTSPTMNGGGLEEGDTVYIYDGGDLIGTASVGVEGTWSFTPSPELNDGDHKFTIVAQDPAGNRSLASDEYLVVVDTASPLSQAVVTSMGKDTGNDSTDFVTNDGTAGRLVQGTLSAALVASEKVQVSTDGGNTWLDALVNGDGTWSFIDQSSHSSNWEIQTRVIDGAGNSNVSTQTVTLDTSVPSPDSVKWDGSSVEIGFDASELSVGSKVHLIIDGVITEHPLSQEDLDAGTVAVSWSAADKGNADSIAVALVDKAGNVSSYREVFKDAEVVLTESFDSLSAQRLSVGQLITTPSFNLTLVSYAPIDGFGYTPGFGILRSGYVTPSTSMALEMPGGTEIRLDLDNSKSFTYISMTTGDFNARELMTATFFDQNGDIAHTVDLVPNGQGLRELTYELPYGMSFSSVTIKSTGPGSFWIDDIKVGNNEYAGNDSPIDPAINQTLTQDAHYYGGADDNIFSLSDTSVLEGANALVSGGAGVDTLQLTGSGQVLDLGAITGKLESIEIIDITGTGNNTLNLSLSDVLEQGQTSLFTDDDTVQMMVKGNAGDVVNLDDLLTDGTDPGDWAGHGKVTVEGVTYNVYQHSSLDAQLLVQDGVTTNLV